MAKTLCIYHAHCADGFGAATVVHQALGAAAVDFHPGVYGDAPPDVAGREVLLVDFSYKREELLRLAAQARRLVVLDHHRSAVEALVDLPANVQTVFDLDKSGAMLAWEYFHAAAPPPLIRHIQDRDLWRFALPGTREIQAALMSYPADFALWAGFLHDPGALARLVTEGTVLERQRRTDLATLLPRCQRRLTIGGLAVPVANLPPALASDAGHLMSQGEPFAACYVDGPDGRRFSLRSAPDGLDVARIAEQYGGGGHPHAAGFTVPRDHPLARA